MTVARIVVAAALAIGLTACDSAVNADFATFCEEMVKELGEPGHPECADPSSVDSTRKQELIDAHIRSREQQAEMDEFFDRHGTPTN